MISLCLIVKDEIKVIEKCLNSVYEKMATVIDDVVVVDTGSTDGTRNFLDKFKCRVFDFEWCNDFAKARNFSLGKAKNDWVLVLDADEFLLECNVEQLLNYIKKENEQTVGEIEVYNYGGFDELSYTKALIPRVFNKKFVEYKGIIHEEPSLKSGGVPKLYKVDISIGHTGYIDEVALEKKKADRNIKLIEKSLAENENGYLNMQLAKSYMRKGDFVKAAENLEKVIFDETQMNYIYYTNSVYEYVRCLLNQKQDQAALVCEKFWDRCFESNSYVYYMGHVYLRNKHYEKALDCFMEIINREEGEISKVMALYSLGQMMYTIGMYEESIKYFEMCGDYSKAKENIVEIKKLI